MSTFPDDPAVFQNDDLVSLFYRCDPLGHDQDGAVAHFFIERSS